MAGLERLRGDRLRLERLARPLRFAGRGERADAHRENLLAAPAVLPLRGLVDHQEFERSTVMDPDGLRAAVEDLGVAVLGLQFREGGGIALGEQGGDAETHEIERRHEGPGDDETLEFGDAAERTAIEFEAQGGQGRNYECPRRRDHQPEMNRADDHEHQRGERDEGSADFARQDVYCDATNRGARAAMRGSHPTGLPAASSSLEQRRSARAPPTERLRRRLPTSVSSASSRTCLPRVPSTNTQGARRWERRVMPTAAAITNKGTSFALRKPWSKPPRCKIQHDNDAPPARPAPVPSATKGGE